MNVNVRTSGQVSILDIQGRVDDASRSIVENAFKQELEAGKTKFVFNMQGVDFLNPGALQMIKECIKQARSNNGGIKLCNVQPAVQKIFDYTGFTDSTAFSPNEKQAIKDLDSIQQQVVSAPEAPPEEYGATIQMGSSPLESLKKQKQEAQPDLYGATIQMGSSPLESLKKKEEKEPDLYGQTIQMGNAPQIPLGKNSSTKRQPAVAPEQVKLNDDAVSDSDFTDGDDGDDDLSFLEDDDEPSASAPAPAPTPAAAPAAAPAPTAASDPADEQTFKYETTYTTSQKLPSEELLGKTYRGTEESAQNFKKPVALKFLNSQEGLAELTINVRKASLVTHQNLAQVHKMISLNETKIVVMEYVDGVSLASILEKIRSSQRFMPPGMASLIIFRLCRALDYANNKLDDEGTAIEMIHGKISPRSVMISRDFDVKLIGLGISKISSVAHLAANSGEMMPYVAPEVKQAKTPSKSGDIFALGALFYELLTNQKPFTPEQITPSLPMATPPSRLNEKVTDILDGLVLRCLSADPARRFEDFPNLAMQLEEQLSDQGFSLVQVSMKNFLAQNNIF